jgi:hypothetical protein
MTNNKVLGSALTGLAATGLIAAMSMGSGLGAFAEEGIGVFADEATQGTKLDTAKEAPISSTVLTEEQCTWYMLGAPSSISLSAGFEKDGDGEDTEIPQEYVGDDLVISSALTSSSTPATTMSLNVYASGNLTAGSANTTSECTFYNPIEAPNITFSVDTTTEFVAKYGTSEADAERNFIPIEAKALLINLSDSGSACDEMWTNTASTKLFGENEGGTLSGLGMTIGDSSSVPKSAAADAGERCVQNLTVLTTIPGDMGIPEGAGQEYTWTGPTINIVRSVHQDIPG